MTAPTTRETADHAELAIVAWAERGPESRELCDVQLFDALTDEDREAGWVSEPLVTAAYVENLLSEIAALRGEVGDLKRHRDRLAITCQRRLDDWRSAQAQATQAERQRDELRKALEPFAEAAESLDDETRDHDHIWEQPAAMSIDAGHLRTARALLANQGADQ